MEQEIEQKLEFFKKKNIKNLLNKGFNSLKITLQQGKDQTEAEEDALRLRIKEQTSHVLKHWIEVGNYWIDKHQINNNIHTLKTSPIKEKSIEKEEVSPDSKYAFTLSKKQQSTRISPKKLNFSSGRKEIIVSEKEK